jgi:hypothetical protein
MINFSTLTGAISRSIFLSEYALLFAIGCGFGVATPDLTPIPSPQPQNPVE